MVMFLVYRWCRHEDVDLIPLIDDVMQQVMPFVQEGVAVYKRVYNLPHITGDSGRIEQVLHLPMYDCGCGLSGVGLSGPVLLLE